MTEQTPNLLELAKQGNTEAIAELINRGLKPQGITAKASLEGNSLQILLEALEIPNQAALVAYLRKGVTALQCPAIARVRVSAQRTGDSYAIWAEEFYLQQSTPPAPSFESPQTAAAPVQTPSPHAIPRTSVPTTRQPSAGYGQPRATSRQQQDLGFELLEVLKDAAIGIKLFLINPVDGLPKFFAGLSQHRAVVVGIVYAVFYILCWTFFVNSFLHWLTSILGPLNPYNLRPDSGFGWPTGGTGRTVNTNVNTYTVVVGAIQFLSIFGVSALIRKLFRGSGGIEGDAFIAGTSLLAPGLFWLILALLNFPSAEVILVLLMLSLAYMVLTLYAGCQKIAQIPEAIAPFATAAILAVSMLMSKILVSIILAKLPPFRPF